MAVMALKWPIMCWCAVKKLLTHYGRGSVVVRQHSDMLCTSGFMDGVIFAHKPRCMSICHRPAEAQCTRSLGLGYKLCAVIPVAGQRTHRTTFWVLKVTSQVATPGWSLRSVTDLFKYWNILTVGQVTFLYTRRKYLTGVDIVAAIVKLSIWTQMLNFSSSSPSLPSSVPPCLAR